MSVEQQTAQILRDIHSDRRNDNDAPAQRLVAACRTETDAAGASLTWCAANVAPLTIAATPGVGVELERLSFLVGESPQAECVTSGRIISRPHLDEGSAEWPAFTSEAAALGVKALFTFPLKLGAISLGVLALYRSRPGTLSDEHLGAALAYVAASTALLLDKPTSPDIDALPTALEDPFALQAEVHQAAGMIAAQLGVDLGTALSLLRAHAYSNAEPINTVARNVVTRRLTIT